MSLNENIYNQADKQQKGQITQISKAAQLYIRGWSYPCISSFNLTHYMTYYLTNGLVKYNPPQKWVTIMVKVAANESIRHKDWIIMQ